MHLRAFGGSRDLQMNSLTEVPAVLAKYSGLRDLCVTAQGRTDPLSTELSVRSCSNACVSSSSLCLGHPCVLLGTSETTSWSAPRRSRQT